MSKLQCAKNTVLVYGVLETIGGLILGGAGINGLNNKTDKIENEWSKTMPIIFIVVVVIFIVDGIIAIVGFVKEYSSFLIIHLMLLCLEIALYAYSVITEFSIFAIVVLLITGLRMGIVSSLIYSLKTNSPVRDDYEALQPLNLAP
ncbi:hypothetical protein CHUAL_001286 [Chamberlinius hualienensis]